MKRNLRNKHNDSIIELSDSSDNDYKILKKFEGKDYVLKQNKKKKNIIDKEQSTKTRVKRNILSKDVKSIKRKNQEINLKTFNNKRLKLEDSLFTDSIDARVSQQIQKHSIKIHAKDYVKLDEKLNSRKIKLSFSECTEWTDVDYISEINNVNKHIVENIVKLFKEDNTIPFIARYRKNMTGSMEPDKLRALLESFEQAKIIKLRAAAIIKNIDKLGKWTPEIHSTITSTKSLADLEYIYSLYKPSASKRLLAEKARGLGLGSISDKILQGQNISPLISLVDEQKEGLRNEREVRSGIVHIIADVISKDKEILDKVISLQKTSIIDIQTIQYKKAENLKNINYQKYEQYFNFKSSINVIKPHHILAINRAELQKIIKVKIVVPDTFKHAFKRYCLSRFTQERKSSAKKFHLDLLNDSIDYAYKKLIEPQMIRRMRNEMKEHAEKKSIEVFATNVKQLLLTPPVRGKIVLGIDPGYRYGCKLAVVSEQGDLLETTVIYPHNHPSAFKNAANTLAKLVNKYRCTIIALGNATACRKTELFLTKAIELNMFTDSLNVMYTIVDECGASIYSCSPQAKSEFPDMDPNLVSAISIARRLQDPLAELVKIEPKHLGVGMYQHDLPQLKLTKTLSEVVTEVVSFVGVDINTASHYLLQHVAGLTLCKTKSIIEWRSKNGPFRNRQQLLKVKNIGSKTFEQCAGFIRILPETAMTSQTSSKQNKKLEDDFNPLDQTWIHPESYTIANKFVKHCQCKLNDIGTQAFIEKINFHARTGYGNLAAQFGTDETTMEIIIKALTMQKDEDIRSKLNQSMFRNSIRCIKDLTIGIILSGIVRNITHFGTFVDVGIGKEGLIHVTRMKKNLHIGQHVDVKVVAIEMARQRVSLELIN